MPSLYEIPIEIRRILDEGVDQETGELSEDAVKALDALAVAADVKIQNTALYIRELLAEAEGIDTEAQRLAKMVKSRENRASRLKRYLLDGMTALGVEKVKGELVTVARQRNPQSVSVLVEAVIPASYWKLQAPVLDKSQLLADLKTGVVIPGAVLAEPSYHVRIR